MWRYLFKKQVNLSTWIDPINKKPIPIIENISNYVICGSNKTTDKKENIIFGTNISVPNYLIQPFCKTNNVRLWYRMNNEFLFPEPTIGWFNLKLKHVTKYTPENLIAVRDTRMCISQEMLDSFLELNKQQFINYKINPKLIFSPCRDVEMICRDEIENSKINNETFSLEGLFLPAQITRVIDGDTCIVKVKMNLDHLSKITHVKKNFIARFFTTKIYIQTIVRWAGIDAQESNTDEGKIAKQIVDEYFKKNDQVWIHFGKFDKFRRQLGVFFTDKNKTKLLNTILMTQENLAKPYKGGKK